MIEMLLVGAIVLVATLYATSAVLPASPGLRLAGRLLGLSRARWCPDWIGRRIRAAASDPGVSGSPCDGCASGRPTDDPSR